MSCEGCQMLNKYICVYSAYNSKNCPCKKCLLKAICQTQLECNLRENWKNKSLGNYEK